MPYEIRAHKDGYRRGGKAHSTTPTRHPDDAFTDEQLQQLEADPRIMIQRMEDPADDSPPPEKPENPEVKSAGKATAKK